MHEPRTPPHAPAALPLPLPEERALRIALVMIRRIAGHGLDDSRAALLAIDAFGAGFRKPLLLVRCLVFELSRASRRRLTLAPCCAVGMTLDEGLIVALIRGEGLAPYAALTDDARCTAPLSSAEALGAELAACELRQGWRA